MQRERQAIVGLAAIGARRTRGVGALHGLERDRFEFRTTGLQ